MERHSVLLNILVQGNANTATTAGKVLAAAAPKPVRPNGQKPTVLAFALLLAPKATSKATTSTLTHHKLALYAVSNFTHPQRSSASMMIVYAI